MTTSTCVTLEYEIMELVKNDNGNTVHFEWVPDAYNLTLFVRTYNPKNNSVFLMYTDKCQGTTSYSRIELLKRTIKYLKTVSSSKDLNSYTVTWAKKNTATVDSECEKPFELFTSYFYGSDILDVWAKFMESKNRHDYIVYSIKVNPVE